MEQQLRMKNFKILFSGTKQNPLSVGTYISVLTTLPCDKRKNKIKTGSVDWRKIVNLNDKLIQIVLIKRNFDGSESTRISVNNLNEGREKKKSK